MNPADGPFAGWANFIPPRQNPLAPSSPFGTPMGTPFALPGLQSLVPGAVTPVGGQALGASGPQLTPDQAALMRTDANNPMAAGGGQGFSGTAMGASPAGPDVTLATPGNVAGLFSGPPTLSSALSGLGVNGLTNSIGAKVGSTLGTLGLGALGVPSLVGLGMEAAGRGAIAGFNALNAEQALRQSEPQDYALLQAIARGSNAGQGPSAANLASMNQGGQISPAAFATLTQGLGITPGQLDAMSQYAGQMPGFNNSPNINQTIADANFTQNTNLAQPDLNLDPALEVNVEDSGTPGGSSGTGPGPGVGDGPGSGNGAGAGGGGASGVGGAPGGGEGDAKGGTVGRRRPAKPGATDTVPAMLTPGEEVISAPEASKPGVRDVLKAINAPGDSPVERYAADFAEDDPKAPTKIAKIGRRLMARA